MEKPAKAPLEVDKPEKENGDTGYSLSWFAPLCISHAVAAWGERSWEFGAGLLLLRLGGEGSDLRLTAVLVFAECLACSLLGPRVGYAVDRDSFLGSAVKTLAVQSLGIAVAAGLMVWAVHFPTKRALPILAILSSVMARLGSLGSTLATELRWAVALSQQRCSYGRLDAQEETTNSVDETLVSEGDAVMKQKGSEVLSRANARLRCIDLTCKLCAPIAVGFLLDYTSSTSAALSIAAFNVIAWPVEVACLVWIHRQYRVVLVDEPVETDTEEAKEETKEEEAPSTCGGWSLYWKQSIFRSALALAVLYLSVVGFGPVMTAWLAATGLRVGHLGIAKAVAAASGMLSTVTTPRMVQSLGLDQSAARYIWFMWVFILPCTVAAFYSEVWIVVACVVVSRFGLWGFDLCVTQMLQERIEPPQYMGEVNGAQVALQNAFDAIAALACIILPDPNTFAFLILGSFVSISFAAALHTSSRCRSASLVSTIPS